MAAIANDAIYLVMDMINDLVHENGPNGKKGYGPELARRNIIANTAVALNKAHAANVKVAYVRVGFSEDYRECSPNSRIFQSARNCGLFKLGTWGTEVHPTLTPRSEDLDIIKHRVSPFYATSLEVILRSNNIHRLFLSGVSTTGVVLSGAKEGHDRDYQVFVLEDCCCALSEAQHQAAIELMGRFAAVTSSTALQFT